MKCPAKQSTLPNRTIPIPMPEGLNTWTERTNLTPEGILSKHNAERQTSQRLNILVPSEIALQKNSDILFGTLPLLISPSLFSFPTNLL
jgi:hypothetical protein